MNRRRFLISTLTLSVPLLTGRSLWAETPESRSVVEKIVKNSEEWQSLLTPKQFHVLRQEGTEPAFSSALNEEKRPGIYHCAGCDLALFTSKMKYDSGTGWPSFTDTLPGHLETKLDFKLIIPRTEYHCARCGGHQGHLFKDGPPPRNERWCNNGVALRFVAT
ncbi:MAG: peptide-methionine (R)-S-oxide reductase MsrB [Magnetococcales bacterium]|nr:peptide-methionine (R)-S-oxide reductase MsrB [Magnetococcales bacterium]